MDVKKCTVCNIKVDKDKNRQDRKICVNCYNENRKKRRKIKKRKYVTSVNNKMKR